MSRPGVERLKRVGWPVRSIVAGAAGTATMTFAYQVGCGIAAFGVGPLLDGDVELSSLYAISAAVAAAMGRLSFAVTRRPLSEPAGLRPDRPAGVRAEQQRFNEVITHAM